MSIILLAGGIGAAHAAETPTRTCVDHPGMNAVDKGRLAYMRLNCYSCHSANGHGGTMGPSLIGEGEETASAVTEGKDGGMPSFNNSLCPGDLDNLTAYINTLGTGTEPTWTHWWEAYPSQ
ncbi:cytochrome c [Methylomicrobium lacus]|uniref:c-type cytochrome n=1 Tax=Methylomicrobium lacus TaxID=136992 RepID=UPI0035A97236